MYVCVLYMCYMYIHNNIHATWIISDFIFIVIVCVCVQYMCSAQEGQKRVAVSWHLRFEAQTGML